MYLLFKHTPENVSNHNRSTNGWEFITDVETLQDFRNKVGDYEDQDYFLQDDGSVTDCDGNEVIDNDPNSTSFDFGDYTYHAIKSDEIDCKYDVDVAKVKAIEEANPHNKSEILEGVVNLDWMEA
tara:strand:- start:631 stop:1005 length:375 start_codon:yes stop_codon:yes gene_type:complete